jgi:hypothetical protein
MTSPWWKGHNIRNNTAHDITVIHETSQSVMYYDLHFFVTYYDLHFSVMYYDVVYNNTWYVNEVSINENHT